MPIQFTGTIQQRYASLEHQGRRCDANGRKCPGAAVERFTLLPTDGFGTVKPDAEPVQRQACSRHRLVFERSGQWQLVSREPIASKPSD